MNSVQSPKTEDLEEKPSLLSKGYKLVLGLFDSYGASFDSPGIREKTIIGALLSTLFRAVVLAIIAYNSYLLLRKDRVNLTEDPIVLNYDAPRAGSSSMEKYYMDVPTVQLRVSQKLYFYEESSSALQKLVIRDMHGYDQTLTSNNNEPNRLRVAKGKKGQWTLSPNTHFARMIPEDAPLDFRSPFTRNANNFMTKTSVGLLGTVKDAQITQDTVVDNLKPFHMLQAEIEQDLKQFVPHTAYMFLRFQDYQLQKLSPCQFQVGIYTEGDMAYLDKTGLSTGSNIPRADQNPETLITLATTHDSWEYDKWSISKSYNSFNMLLLKKEVTEEMIEQLQSNTSYGHGKLNMKQAFPHGLDKKWFMNWNYFINYVPSFKIEYANYYCFKQSVFFQALDEDNLTEDAKCPQALSSGIMLGWRMGIYPPSSLDTVIYFVVTKSPSLFEVDKPAVPVKTFLLDSNGNHERITVTNIEFTARNDEYPTWGSMTVTRSKKPVDFFAKTPIEFQNRIKNMPTVSGSFPNFPPPSWSCSNSKYKDGLCDCDCGALDPDCQTTLKNATGLLSKYEQYASSELLQSGKFCDAKGESFFPTSYVMIGPRCGEMIAPLETDVMFLFGDKTLYNSVGTDKCPVKKSTMIKVQNTAQQEIINSMETLEIDYAFFTIPKRVGWDEGYTLQVGPSTNYSIEPLSKFSETKPDYKAYSLKPGRNHKFENYSLKKLSAQDCTDTNYDLISRPSFACIKQMPPTRLLQYDHVIQINNKWSTFPEASAESLLAPEWTMSFRHDYIFHYDSLVEEVDKQFRSLDVDSISSSDEYQYFKYDYGKRFFSGKFNSTAVENLRASDDSNFVDLSYFAASSPILQTTLAIELSPFAASDATKAKYILRSVRGTWRGLYTNTEQKLQKKWNNLVITFDTTDLVQTYNDAISLKPGYTYSLSATVQISSTYSRGMFNQEDIESFDFEVVSTSVSKSALTPELGNRAIVEYKILFTRGDRTFVTNTYNIFTFFAAVGGALGFMSIGSFILLLIQKIHKPHSIIIRLQEEDRVIINKKTCFGKSPEEDTELSHTMSPQSP